MPILYKHYIHCSVVQTTDLRISCRNSYDEGLGWKASNGLPCCDIFWQTCLMKMLARSVCLTFVVLLSNPTIGKSADLQDGLDAYDGGDYETALREWQPLAEQGTSTAQFMLGVLYGDGEGVTQDYVRAYMWSDIAALQGHEAAKFNRGVFAGKMTRSQLELAQALSKECVKKNYKGC